MRLNTVTKKIMALMLASSIVVVAVISALFPSIFYHVMKPHLLHQISSVVSSSALRQSYIWKNNNTLNTLQNSEELHNLIAEYELKKENQPEESENIKEQILTFLPFLRNGVDNEDPTGEHGYIISTHYFFIFTDQGEIFLNPNAEDAVRILLSSDWYRDLDKTQEFFGHPPVMEDPDNLDSRILCMVSSFRVGDMNCFGVNAVSLDDILAQFYEFYEFGLQDFLLYGDGNIIYQNLPDASNIDLSRYPEDMFSGNQYEIRLWEDADETNFMTLCTYKKEAYRIALNVPKDLLLEPYREAFQYFQLLLGIIVVVLLILFCVTTKGNLKRLVRLERKMNHVREGDYNVSVTDNQNDEISSLAHTFNMMLQKIREDMKNEEKMQYTLMVSAIDPHYIYNTLNTITALAELGRNEDVVAVNDALTGTLKDRMKLKNYKIFDTVRSEREALRQYMVIQSYLCYQKILFQFQVDEKDLDLLIPKNIIQPLVENSIKHGILCMEDDDCEASTPYQGQIAVSVSREETAIHIKVSDNGIGMEEETLQQFFSQERKQDIHPEKNMEHIGTYNVQMRLHYLYQGNDQFLVDSQPGHGTRIHLILPLAPSLSDLEH